MIEKLKASARDVVLAALAAFTGAFAVALEVGVTLPVLKATAVSAGYAAARAAVGAIAVAITRFRDSR